MPRHTATSTAIAALLALGLAAPALAEITLPADKAREAAPARIKGMTLLNNVLQKELEAGVNQGALRCLDGSDRPCADDMPLITPAGVAVQMVDDGSMILAPANLQPYRMDKDGMPIPRANEFTRLANQNLDRAAMAAAALNRKPAPPVAVIEDQSRPADGAKDVLSAEIERARNQQQDEQAAAEARARADADILIAAGLPAEMIEIDAMGEADAPVATDDGVAEPLNRCAEIRVVRL